ncbi:Alpha/Beta hydrolase protein [Mycena albidolilacea]|uniref:triacylglycerol lipase n=1 Tax=Mycena albidolilacea TaxID=1033008 RepID=A0AAD7ER37_9AGAR|nr:Alpha/Beta hydrolase protein [Mycena albidolilacea]
MFIALPNALRLVLAAFLCTDSKDPGSDNTTGPALRFQLRHEHAVANGSRSVFADVPRAFLAEYHEVPTRNIKTHRPPSAVAFSDARLLSMRHAQSPVLAWNSVEVPGPDITKRNTLFELATMTHDSYYGDPGHKNWYPLRGWNASVPFGWEPDADGFRGHVFVSEDNSTVVISVKGTSVPWIAGGEGPTKKRDKLNDNLLFSCCCARVGPTWSTVCNCYSGGDKCDQNCLENALLGDSLYYQIGLNLYNDVAYMYPDANIWLTGHSLGGALASLLGATFGAPVVAFEVPGDKMAASRLHLPSPPSTHHITHVYHTGDPMAMGTCTGVTSPCYLGGFALETRCHLGQRILYDTVTKRGWSVDSRSHSIQFLIDNLFHEDWDVEAGMEVPPVDEETDCIECYNWQFGNFK